MIEGQRKKIGWLDLLLLIFLAGLAILPPVGEYHKQLTLLGIGILQLSEGWLIARLPKRGPSYVVLLKILLATLLLDHTGDVGINSSYYPIYYLPVVTAALYFGTWTTLLWTLVASAAYCSYLYPALQEYELDAAGVAELTIRILFFFLAAGVVNRFAVASRRQTERYQKLAEELAETNRRLEQAQEEARRSERLVALGQLSAGLAHEIRNPLGVMKGSAEMLNEKLRAADPLSSELAGYISGEVDRLNALVNRFLDFARPLRATATPQEVAPLVERALKSVAQHWRGGEVSIQRKYEENLPPVPLDEGLCEQAFLNLVQNAYEAMGERGGTLRAEISAAESDGRRGVEIRLEDTGPGVPAELHEQIFNPFVTTKPSGVGLGLSIVAKIVEEHHGTIHLETAPGGGARFVIFFPAQTAGVRKETALLPG